MPELPATHLIRRPRQEISAEILAAADAAGISRDELRTHYEWSALACEIYEDIWILSDGYVCWTGWIGMRGFELVPIPPGRTFRVPGRAIEGAADRAEADTAGLGLRDLTEEDPLPELPEQRFFPRIHAAFMFDFDLWDEEQRQRYGE